MSFHKKNFITMICAFVALGMSQTSESMAQSKSFRLFSPDKKLSIQITTGQKTTWAVWSDGDQVLLPSPISLELNTGEKLGESAKVRKSSTQTVNQTFSTPLYKKSAVTDHYNQLTLDFTGNYSLIFRAYDDGVAYHFETNRKDQLTIQNEQVVFQFSADHHGLFGLNTVMPVVGDPYSSFFEALYNEFPISQFPDTIAFLPSLINLPKGKKLAILEAGLENYPGMFLQSDKNTPYTLTGIFAPYPTSESLFKNMVDTKVNGRENFIAKVNGRHIFPWRVMVVSATDKDLLNNDMVQKLTPPARIADVSWIRPGKVAWDWWSDINVSNVPFKAGINTETYKYYIDFASKYKLEYIAIDAGWSNDTNLLQVNPFVQLDSIVDYGKQKNVGVILWATIYAVSKNTDSLFAYYSKLGIEGFKIDFIDRDDQQMVQRLYAMAALAAKHKLVIDLHGMYKPSGIQRVYPNILNYEGVRGMEYSRGSEELSVPKYDVQIPFIRMLSGPMDYTPGAMRNANKNNFRAIGSMPMSLGTRCHQLAMYVIYEAPLQMLSDNPTAYQQDSTCTQFMASFPTVFDESVALEGVVGEFAVIARRKGNDWYIGALNNWDARDMQLPAGFLGEGIYEAEIFSDGVNAERDGTDHMRQIVDISKNHSFPLHMAAGGGWAAILRKKTIK